MIDEKNILTELEKSLMTFGKDPKTQNVGIVEKNTDGVITVAGLTQASMGEKVVFEDGTSGVILNLDEDYVSVILLGEGDNIKEGDNVKKTGETLSINASEELLGRVVNVLGDPLDGKPKIKKEKFLKAEIVRK